MKDLPDSLQPRCIAFFFLCITRSKNVDCPIAWPNALEASHNHWPLIGWTSGRSTRHRSVSQHTGAHVARPFDHAGPRIEKREPERRWHPEEGGWPLIARDPRSSQPASWCCGNPHTPTPTDVDVLRKNLAAGNTGDLARCMEDQEDWKHRWRSRPRTA